MLDFIHFNNKEKIGEYYGYKGAYLASCYTNSREKYDFLSSFDDYLFISLLKYKEFLINLFYKASMIEIDIDKKDVESILSLMNVNSTHRYYEFSSLLNCVIDEDNFLTINMRTVKKVMRFIYLSNELGFSEVDVGLPKNIDMRGME